MTVIIFFHAHIFLLVRLRFPSSIWVGDNDETKFFYLPLLNILSVFPSTSPVCINEFQYMFLGGRQTLSETTNKPIDV